MTSLYRLVRWLAPSTMWGVAGWLLAFVFAVAVAGPNAEADSFWHVWMGRDILFNHRLSGDPSWTFGPAESGWITTNPFVEVLFYGLFAVAGWPGLVFFRMVGTAVVVISLMLAVRASAPSKRLRPLVEKVAFWVALIAGLGLLSAFEERPQMFSLVLLPWVGLAAVRLLRAGVWPRWWVVAPVALAWGWAHGSVILVAPLLALAAVIYSVVHAPDEGIRQTLSRGLRLLGKGWGVLVSLMVAPILSPAGLDYYTRLPAISAATKDVIIEWSKAPVTYAPFVVLVGFAILALAAAAFRVSLPSRWEQRTFLGIFLFLLALVLLALNAARYAVTALPIAAVIAAYWVIRLRAATKPPVTAAPTQSTRWMMAVPFIAVGVTLVSSVILPLGQQSLPPDAPSRIFSAMSTDGLDHRLVVSYNIAGMALTHAGDGVSTSIDGRADRYGTDGIRSYMNMELGLPGWREKFFSYPNPTDVLMQEKSPIVELLQDDGWRLICTDNGYAWLSQRSTSADC